MGPVGWVTVVAAVGQGVGFVEVVAFVGYVGFEVGIGARAGTVVGPVGFIVCLGCLGGGGNLGCLRHSIDYN